MALNTWYTSTVALERKARVMANYDIRAVILDNHVEGSLPKGLAKQIGLAVLARLVAPDLTCEPAWRLVMFFSKEIF